MKKEAFGLPRDGRSFSRHAGIVKLLAKRKEGKGKNYSSHERERGEEQSELVTTCSRSVLFSPCSSSK